MMSPPRVRSSPHAASRCVIGGAIASLCGFLAVAGLAACNQNESAAPPPRFRNLVVVMIDTLRSDHLSSYGYHRDTAPFLASIAEDGIQVQGISASSWTRPSIATLLTGLHPQRHQAIARSDALPESVAYLPQYLQERGFQTAAYLSNGNVSSELGFARGFDLVEEYGDKPKPEGSLVTDGGLRLADRLAPPFFLYVHYLDPHDPYVPAQPWGADQPRPLVQPQDIMSGRAPFDEPTLQRMRDSYDGEIREMDPEIERLVRGLEQRGLLQDTLVVFTSDHGEAFGEHGKIVHGHTLHREEVEVPFLMWSLPSRWQPHRSKEIFHQVDFMATMLDALGVEQQPDGDGETVWAQLATGQPLPASTHYLHLDLDRFGELAIQSDGYKLIHRRGRPTNLLYHLAADPDELAMIEDGTPAEAEARRRLLRQLIHLHNELAAGRSQRQVESIDGDLRDRLVALGYLNPQTSDERLAERVIPPRLNLFDHRTFGLFGHERIEEFSSTLGPDQGQPPQWLTGWLIAGAEGRWCGQEATAVLPKPAGADHVLLRGRSTIPNRLQVTINRIPAGSWPLPLGPFELRIPLPADLNQRFPLLYVDLSVEQGAAVPGFTEAAGFLVRELSVETSPPAS